MSWFFWIFLSMILIFQLSAVDDYTLPQALIYSLIITGTFCLYATLLIRYLIRKQIKSKKTTFFILWILLCSMLVSCLLTAEDYMLESLFAGSRALHLPVLLPRFFGMWMATILISGVAYAFELHHHHIETLKSAQQLKDSINEMEMISIRQQLSPHFTFNILNNLQFLIQKDRQEALDLLSQYSRILRYYVYESRHKAILLQDEISFLKTYLELEKDRLKEEAVFETSFSETPHDLKMAPFILTTFIENAFKHLSRENKWIAVELLTTSAHLRMHVQNTYDSHNRSPVPGGTGLAHVSKRLELIYPGKYTLDFQKQDNIFAVTLNLNFEPHEN